MIDRALNRRAFVIALISPLITAGSVWTLNARSSTRMKDQLNIAHVATDFEITDFDNKNWDRAKAVTVKTYWSGKPAPDGRQFSARLLWSDVALYVRFEAPQNEPLVISNDPNLNKKTIGVWDRDVCEIFIAPDADKPDRYFEFEVAPTGEWVDLAIEFRSGKRITDFEYSSGMTSAARVVKDKVVSAIKIPWKALGKTPKTGDMWRGNLFRCVGKDPDRGYVAWQPTLTDEPSFHVPEKFGVFRFS